MAKYKRQKVKHYHRSFYSRETRVKRGIGIVVLVAAVLVSSISTMRLKPKQILAQIMKGCVDEYSECSVEEIAEKYIEGTPEVGTVGVHVDDTNRSPKAPEVITGSNNEDSTLTEGTINYDVRFDAIAPASEGSTAQKDVIRLIINVEAQTAFNPGYPLTKRAIYYCSRMISAQHGPIFTNSEYGKIRKVYSIWVCTHPTKEFQNTLVRYSIRPEQSQRKFLKKNLALQ